MTAEPTERDHFPVDRATRRFIPCTRCETGQLPIVGGPAMEALSDEEFAQLVPRMQAMIPLCRECQEKEWITSSVG